MSRTILEFILEPTLVTLDLIRVHLYFGVTGLIRFIDRFQK